MSVYILSIIDEMKISTWTYIDKNYYMFDYFNDIVEEFSKLSDIAFSKRFMILGEIKKSISQSKK